MAKVCHSFRAELHSNRQEEKGLAHVDMAWFNPSKPDGGLPDEPTYDMVLTVDAVHDMARPDQVLPLVRKVSAAQAPSCLQALALEHHRCCSRLSARKPSGGVSLRPKSGGHACGKPACPRFGYKDLFGPFVLILRQATKPDGGWLVFDMRGKATPAENFADPQVAMLAPILYGFSVHLCLPSGDPCCR